MNKVKKQGQDKERVGMIEHMLENNKVLLIGKVVSDTKFSHKVYGEGFYTFDLEVPRLSESADILPVTISERLLPSIGGNIQGKVLEIEGQFRSYNQYEEGKNRLILTIFIFEVKEVNPSELSRNKNEIYLNGFVCKAPIYRTTPFGREITDLLLAVNRSYHKSDYIPCITWGRNARFAQNLNTGDHIQISGRIQSRTYQKKLETGEVEVKIAYEVSIGKMEQVDENTPQMDHMMQTEEEEIN